MQCSQCGSANADDSRFCTTCGAALGAPDPAAVPSAPAPQPQVQPVYAPPPQAPPPGYAAPVYAPPPPQAPAPKKKRTGCIIAIVILAVLFLCCLGSAAAIYFGVASLGKPRDLGVSYTQKDYDSATVKLGIDVSKAGPDSPTAKGEEAAPAGTDTGSESSSGGGTEAAPPGVGASGAGASAGSGGGGTSGGASGSGQVGASGGVKTAAPVTSGPAAGTTVIYEGSVPVDIELTNEEFSALISLNHYSPNWLVKDMQVRFGDGNTVEMSGYVEYEGQRYPVFVAGTAQVTGPRTVGGTATVVNVAGYDVPAEYYPLAADFLAGLMNDWLAQMEGLSLESVEISDGLVHIKGSVPASVIRVPASQ